MNAKIEAAVAWLKPRLPANIVQLHAEGRRAGYALGDLRSASSSLGVMSDRRDGKEFWFLAGQTIPPQPPAPATGDQGSAHSPTAAELSPEAARAELARRLAILSCPEAVGRESLAIHTAEHTSMTLAEARAMMATSAIAAGTEDALIERVLAAGKALGMKVRGQQGGPTITAPAAQPRDACEETEAATAARIVAAGGLAGVRVKGEKRT